MKKSACLWAMLACLFVFTFNAGAQTVTRTLSGYSGIECNGPFNLSVKTDSTESVRLDVDAEVLNDVVTVVENGMLKISLKNRSKHHGNLKRADIFITANQLNYLASRGSGNTVLTGAITGENTRIALSGSGDMKVTVKTKKLDLSVSGSSNLDIKGNADIASIGVFGSGDVKGKELYTETIKAKIFGSGSVTLSVNQTISASVAGSGSLQYYGDAKIIDSHHFGSGSISKINEAAPLR